MRPKHAGLFPKVLTVSSIEGVRIAESWTEMAAIHDVLATSGQLKSLRAEQNRRWFLSEVQAALSERILGDPAIETRMAVLEADVLSGRALAPAAAQSLLSGMIR
jgi:putative protein kinase ArgK-like GTPase of G3E family